MVRRMNDEEVFDRDTFTGIAPPEKRRKLEEVTNDLVEEEDVTEDTDWETESDASAIGAEEAGRHADIREWLRKHGPNDFLVHFLIDEHMSAAQLLRVFFKTTKIPQRVIDGTTDDLDLLPLLKLAISRELSRREKLEHVNTIDDAVELLRTAKNVIVLTGAGISTSLGIPDFRSDTGLYAMVEEMGLSEPQEMFDIELFRQDPSVFYSFAANILPHTNKFSPTHAFIRLLEERGCLLANYTQNIDGLERLAGISGDKVVNCHGSFSTASCTNCHRQVDGAEIFDAIRSHNVPRCTKCHLPRGEDDAEREAGVMKPDITFFGEALPNAFEERLLGGDAEKCDLLLCIGTSLKVAPVSELIGILPPATPQLYISKTPIKHATFDVNFLGSCDAIIAELCRRLEWDLRHHMLPHGAARDCPPRTFGEEEPSVYRLGE